MRRLLLLILALIMSVSSFACGRNGKSANDTGKMPETEDAAVVSEPTGENETQTELSLTIGNTPVKVDWQNNSSVAALKELVKDKPLTINMTMYGGFEQVGAIGQSVARNDSQTTTRSGDIVLYSGNQIVIFYGSNSWSYTRLGRVTDKNDAQMRELLANGNTSITIEIKER